jgi:hypothetical protein
VVHFSVFAPSSAGGGGISTLPEQGQPSNVPSLISRNLDFSSDWNLTFRRPFMPSSDEFFQVFVHNLHWRSIVPGRDSIDGLTMADSRL